MATFVDALIYILPTIVIGVMMIYIVYYFSKKIQTPALPASYPQHKSNNLEGLRLQACERLVLFLERIRPHSLLIRLQGNYKDIDNMHHFLLKNIRDEFDHNITQQVYISDSTWSHVRYAKENLVNIINEAINTVEKNNTTNLSSAIIELYASQKEDPIELALKALRKEVKETLR